MNRFAAFAGVVGVCWIMGVDTRPAGAQVLYAIATDADARQLRIPPLTPAAERPNRQENALFNDDLLLQIDFAAHKRHYLLDRPRGTFQTVTASWDGAYVVCLAHRPHSDSGDVEDSGKQPDAFVTILSSAGKLEHRFTIPSSAMLVRSAPQLLAGGERVGFARRTAPKARNERPGPAEVVTTDLKGGDLRVLGPGESPAWSADGRTILFSAPVDVEGRGIHYRVMTMDADGRRRRPIGPPDSCDGAFSPDGKRIVYLKLGPGRTDVIVANADGSAPRRITAIRTVYVTPRWLDNGRIVVAANTDSLKPVTPDGPKAPPKPAPPIPAGDDGLTGDLATPDTLFVLAADGSATHRLFPMQAMDAALDRPRHEGVRMLIDGENDEITHLKVPGQIPWPKRPNEPPGARLIFQGDKAFVKDDFGQLKRARDGFYLMPDGRQILIRGGKKVEQPAPRSGSAR